jgi:hypothetical protein
MVVVGKEHLLVGQTVLELCVRIFSVLTPSHNLEYSEKFEMNGRG